MSERTRDKGMDLSLLIYDYILICNWYKIVIAKLFSKLFPVIELISRKHHEVVPNTNFEAGYPVPIKWRDIFPDNLVLQSPDQVRSGLDDFRPNVWLNQTSSLLD